MGAEPKYFYTPQEYRAFERSSPEKHEYFNGEVFRMAGVEFSTHNYQHKHSCVFTGSAS